MNNNESENYSTYNRAAIAGLGSAAISYFMYKGETVDLPFLSTSIGIPTYVGLSAFAMNVANDTLLDLKEPVLAAGAVTLISLGLNEFIGRPMNPTIIATIAFLPPLVLKSDYVPGVGPITK